MFKEYYEPKDIWFTREQVMFIIVHLETMREGIWPQNPLGSGYINQPIGKRSRSRHASFETPVGIAAEVLIRLEKCGIEGKLLVAEVQSGKTFSELEYESRRALNYISGWRQRLMSYTKWCYQRKRRYELERPRDTR